MKRLLLQLDSDKHPSSFDRIVAYDADVDAVLSYGGVVPEDVTPLVHGCLFTRGLADLKHTAIWIGGSQVVAGEALTGAVNGAFFGPFRVSVMMDSNGCNTTAAAAVARLAGATALSGTRVVVLGGTGPVGLRAAVLLAREGASVTISSRSMGKGQDACAQVKARFGVTVAAVEAKDDASVARAVDGVQVCLTAGAAGVTLLPRAVWMAHPSLAVMADVNAVPPLGIEGIEAGDKGLERNGKRVFGALAIGGHKMKVHKACVARLFERNDSVLDLEAIWEIAKAL
jgi:methylenetetrahydrofolate/methylenetetrahydromethanopterin dehydrogenase (NADP+)